jgi:hypothetical protein
MRRRKEEGVRGMQENQNVEPFSKHSVMAL